MLQLQTSPSPLLEARFPNPMITTVKTSSVVQGMPKYRSMLAGNPAYTPPSFESIATATSTGSSTSLTISSIPSTFKHLQLRIFSFDSNAGNILIRFNSDSGTNYARHQLGGNGSAVSASGSISQTYINGGFSGYVTNQYAVSIIDILDYGSTTKNKTTRTLFGIDNNGSGNLIIYSGLWLNTSAITSITMTNDGSPLYTFSSLTQMALYGIKEA